jgi:leucine dehydrogenase
MTEVSRIGERVVELLERCKTSGRTPAAEADAWAQTLI